MKCLSKQARGGFTLVELAVVIVVVVVLASILFPAMQKERQKSWRIRCLNNLKEIGTADRLWAGDHGDGTPFQTSIAKGGWSEYLTNSNAGPYCWKYYATMANELGLDPRLLVCRADERKPAADFKSAFKDNTTVSYFVGVDANDIYPQSIAGGDRNIGPGTVPDPNYGYSPAGGSGNDVILNTNTPVSWSLKMHSQGSPGGAGNIVLGDGSAQQVSSGSLAQNWLRSAWSGTNFSLGATNRSGIRLVFP